MAIVPELVLIKRTVTTTRSQWGNTTVVTVDTYRPPRGATAEELREVIDTLGTIIDDIRTTPHTER